MADVSLRFLGSGDAFSSAGRLQTCLVLEGAGERLLIDCGATALAGLKRERIDPSSIGFVAISHLHGDHFGGLPWLLIDGRFSKRSKPLVIAGPPGIEKRFEQALEALYPGALSAELPFELRFEELSSETRHELGPAQLTPFDVVHNSGAPCYALRIEYGGRVIAFSGDTEWTDSLLDAARGSDLFVCECNDFDQQVPGHLNYRTLEAKRSELDSRRLILTHMGPDMLAHLGGAAFEAEDVMDATFETAEDGMLVSL
jgi:ribonuclease BN (tRNA processing enzyme)